MFRDNDYYGHGELLRRHAGLAGRRAIPGRLQHGWTPELGLPRHNFAEPWPQYLWSQRNLDRCREAGVGSRAVAIGAPFLYLPPAPPRPEPPPRSLLVLPFHGWEKGGIEGDFARYADSVAELERQGFGPVTVCLYWLEYEDPKLRALFAQRGWRVVTNGHRDDNPAFLHKQRDLLLDHALVSSNRVCTATFYALAAGRPFFLHGPTMGLDGSRDPTGAEFDRWQRAHFAELTFERFDGTCHRELGLRELGAEHVRAPEALRALFGWTPAGHGLHAWRAVQRRLWQGRNLARRWLGATEGA